MGRHLRPFFAWYGDMELAGHLWQFLGIGRSRVEVRFHETATIDRFASRKELATWCHAIIAAGVAGRWTCGTSRPPCPAAAGRESAAGPRSAHGRDR